VDNNKINNNNDLTAKLIFRHILIAAARVGRVCFVVGAQQLQWRNTKIEINPVLLSTFYIKNIDIFVRNKSDIFIKIIIVTAAE